MVPLSASVPPTRHSTALRVALLIWKSMILRTDICFGTKRCLQKVDNHWRNDFTQKKPPDSTSEGFAIHS